MIDLEKKQDSWKGRGDQILRKTKFINRAARKIQPMKNYTL